MEIDVFKLVSHFTYSGTLFYFGSCVQFLKGK